MLESLRCLLAVRWFSTEDRRGFTLIELSLVGGIVGLLAALAVPNLTALMERARIARAIGDIKALGQNVIEFSVVNNRFPASPAEAGLDGFVDPWGNPYGYLELEGLGEFDAKKVARKDRFLKPLNTDFDLWSNGADGIGNKSIGTRFGKDDIVRAMNGGWVGLGEDF